MSNPDLGPTDPSQGRFKLIPVTAAALAASIQPFPQQLLKLSSKAATHAAVVGDRIVVQVPLQPPFGAPENLAASLAMSVLPEPFLQLLEFGSILLLGRASFHLELARPGLVAVEGEPQKVKIFRLLSFFPRVPCGEPSKCFGSWRAFSPIRVRLLCIFSHLLRMADVCLPAIDFRGDLRSIGITQFHR